MFMNPTGMVNPMAQILMPLCQSIISDMMPKNRAMDDFMTPLSIQLDEQFAAMAERYFDNLYDGRMPVPHQFKEIVHQCMHDGEHEHKNHDDHSKWGAKAPHRVFMAAVDAIAINPAKADEIISEHFEGVTDEERRVLKQYAKSRPTTRAQAQAVSMTEELYISRLEAAMNKTK